MYKITVGVDGMVCGMCEAHINEAIRKNFSVKKVKSSKRKKQTVITCEDDIDDDAIRSVINETGYTPGEISREVK